MRDRFAAAYDRVVLAAVFNTIEQVSEVGSYPVANHTHPEQPTASKNVQAPRHLKQLGIGTPRSACLQRGLTLRLVEALGWVAWKR